VCSGVTPWYAGCSEHLGRRDTYVRNGETRDSAQTGVRWGLGLLVAVGLLGVPSKTVAESVIGGVMAGGGVIA
jgi:hypothetical protein